MKSSRRFWIGAGNKFENGIKAILLLAVEMYRVVGAVHLGGACRFEPSCSEYAIKAVKIHKPWMAVRLIVGRILRCRPGGEWGFDPVPPSPEERKS